MPWTGKTYKAHLRLAFLQAPTYSGYALGAVHYWPRIDHDPGDGSGTQQKELYHILTAAEAAEFNRHETRKRGGEPPDFLDKAGDRSSRYLDMETVHREAIAQWRTMYPDALALVEESISTAQPGFALDGPPDFVAANNVLYARGEACGGWDNEPEMEAICEEYYDLLERMVAEHG